MRVSKQWLIVLAVVVVHIAVLVPLIGSDSFIIDNVFHPYAEGMIDGAAPYGSLGFEYPPGAIPIVVLPGLISDAIDNYREAFDTWMLIWDLGILVLLGWVFRADRYKLAVALAIYSLGVLVLGRLLLARFDLVPAALSLAALVLYQKKASFCWGLSLGIGAIVKGWTIALAPIYLFRDRHRHLAVLGLVIPLVAGIAGVWLVFGEEPGSAFSYHADRGLQIESIAATFFLVGEKLGLVEIEPTFGAGSFNIEGTGVSLARSLSIVLLFVGYLTLLLLIVRRKTDTDLAVTLITGWLVVVAPVLSPQFLIWIMPLAAYTFAQHWQVGMAKAAAATLVVTSLFTRLAMENYDQISFLGDDFVGFIFVRNLVFVLWLVLTAILALKMRTPSSEKMSL